MKLFVFQAAMIHTNKALIIPGSPNQEIAAPVPFYLIEHEKGYVLYDTGFNLETVQDAKKALPELIYYMYNPEVFEDGYVLNAIKKAGVSPEDIAYCVCSHLHFDHAGGIGLFPNATYIVQRQELHYAYVPDPFMQLAYCRTDFDKNVNWLLLDGWNDNAYDIFGDGKLVIYFTPGHTPGHQSLMVNFKDPIMLTGDACYITENLENFTLPSLVCDNSAYINNLKRLKDMQKRGVQIMIGHDPDVWATTKKFPEFYS